MTSDLDELCARYGVVWQYVDVNGEKQSAPEETRLALLNALGLDIKSSKDASKALVRHIVHEKRQIIPETCVTEPRNDTKISFIGNAFSKVEFDDALLVFEDGKHRNVAISCAVINLGKLPIGIHELQIEDISCLIICAPSSIPLPARSWGAMVPLYGLRNNRDWGIGDFRDLAQCFDQFAQFGISFVGINPVHASFPCDATAYSPYSPSSRRFLNTIHIAPEDIDGSQIRFEREPRLNDDDATDLVEYDKVLSRKHRALEAVYAANNYDNTEFQQFKKQAGKDLIAFATHQSLSKVYGAYWSEWPLEYQTPENEQVAQFREQHSNQIDYQAWLQWQAHKQLAECKKRAEQLNIENGLYVDLAVGVHPHGAETWADEAGFARDVSLGAPADSFSADGQNWGLAPLNPVSLKNSKFSSFVKTLRSQLEYAGLLRIDHIIGFERSFWIPKGLPGAYIKMPTQEMMAILRIEAHRSGASIIGEDLGNIPDGFQDDLKRNGILGCRVTMFERDWSGNRSFTNPQKYSQTALASLGTHDLPPFAGWWSGTDIQWRYKLGHISKDQLDAQLTERQDDTAEFENTLQKFEHSSPDKKPTQKTSEAPILRAHAFLAASNSCLVAVQVEDMLALDQSANLPGTVFDHPNWRRIIPCEIVELKNIKRLAEISTIMEDAGRTNSQLQKSNVG